ncbi:hypothetical protein [Flavobacterium nackdongense]|uniref:Uncharacterized protein n=1 Tax=Flavobacterium nackdongense TaxID=2547394 RepID=A0A4P6YDH2_9FLAO|nr:hypothetical protein [Flavobacterium nackdongense]QBN18423.1 hypothetical protein E1750_06240 [Flavobacterium nackdongense]
MATQICPKCKTDNFVWNIDEEETSLTKWSCLNCNYVVFENESDERNCLVCNHKSETKLKDNSTEFWWCSNCNTTTKSE